MKAKTSVLSLVLIALTIRTLFSQESPIKDFRLPNDELVTIFIGENNWQAPYIQCVDFANNNYMFRNLYENMTQIVDHGSDVYYPCCATNGNFDANNQTTELILGTLNNSKIILQHAICDQTGIKQVKKLNSTISEAYNPCIVSGCFTPEARRDNREEVVLATNYAKRYIRLNGFRFSTAGTEIINRFYNKDCGAGNYYMSPVNIVACDYDGDNFDEICIVYGYYFPVMSLGKISIDSFDWTPLGESSISFPLGVPNQQNLNEWPTTNRNSNIFRISAGDINNDGNDEVIMLRDLRFPNENSGFFNILVFSYDNDNKHWSQMEFENMQGTLLDKNSLFNSIETRDWNYDNIQLKVGDLDNNGCCDIAASLTYKTSSGKECMHYWVYTFQLDAIKGLVAKEELNDKRDNTGLKHAMAITNMDGDKYSEIYYVTDTPKLFAVTYDTTRKEFKAMEEKSTSSNNYNYSAHGFTWPMIIPVDIDNDSYWCRYKREMFSTQTTTPFIGKPVAIINPPPYQEEVNPNTFIDIKFKTAHDTLASVQTQTGYGYDFEISAGVKWLGTKTIFETSYHDTVMNKKEFYEGNSDNNYWDCHKNAIQVIFPTSGYDIYPYRIESFTGDPIKSDTGEDLFLYIFKPKDSGTHLEIRTWENYLTSYEDSYGTEQKNKLEQFMSPFMQHRPGNIASFMKNSNPYVVYSNLDKAFPTMEQEINTAYTQYQKEWGKTNRTDGSCKRSQRWENKIDIPIGHDWGVVSAKAHLKFYNFTTTKEMTGSSNEDGILIKLNFQGVGEPNTDDDNKYYKVTSYAFWGPENVGLNGAIIISHQVTEIGSYYSTEVSSNRPIALPERFSIEQNYPNPFNAATSIQYALPKATDLKIMVYDLKGRLVETIFNGHKEAGYHCLNWDASYLASGSYFYQIKTNDYIDTKKVILLK